MIRRSGRRGQNSRSFNATTTAYNFGSNNAAFATNTAQTVLILMRPTGAGENNAGYVFARLSGASTDGMRFIVSHNSGNPTMTWGQGSVTASAPNVVTNTGFVTYGDWMWAAGTFDGSITGANMHLYRAGLYDPLSECTYASQTDGSGAIDTANGLNLYVGNRQGTDRTFNGDIAMVAWWGAELTLDELEEAKQFGPGGVRRADLKLLWADGFDYASGREATVTGAAAGRPVKYAINPPKQVVFPGFAVAGSTAYALDAQPASFTITGTAAGLVPARVLDAQPAAYTITGTAAGLVPAYALDAQPAAYTITGFDADLVHTVTGAYALDAQPASFAITAADAGLIAGRNINAAPAAYTITAADADLVKTAATAYALNAEPYSMTITAFDATLFTDAASAAVESVTGGWPTREEYERHQRQVKKGKKARKEPEIDEKSSEKAPEQVKSVIPEERKPELRGLIERISEQYRGAPIERQTAKALKRVHTDLDYDILPSEVPAYEGFITESLRKKEEERIIVQIMIQLMA